MKERKQKSHIWKIKQHPFSDKMMKCVKEDQGFFLVGANRQLLNNPILQSGKCDPLHLHLKSGNLNQTAVEVGVVIRISSY